MWPKPPNGDAGSASSSARSRSARRSSLRSCWRSTPMTADASGILGIRGVDDASPRTANASRARDPQFDSAVIGNSTGQLLKPSELSGLTGRSFVQLTVPGTGPREQLAIMDFFVRQHPQVGALVIVTDASWCQRDPALPMQHPFPFWLYGESTLGLHRPTVLHARATPWLAARHGRAWAAPAQRAGRLLGLREGGARRACAGDRVPWRRRAGARRGEPELPRGCVAGRRDQEASGRCSGRAARAAELCLNAAAAGHACELPKRRPATRHCAGWSPAARAATSSIIVSTTNSRATARTSWTSAITARLSRARWSRGSPKAFGSAVMRRSSFDRDCRHVKAYAAASATRVLSRPSSHSVRAAPRWILPLVVFGSVPGRISTMCRA